MRCTLALAMLLTFGSVGCTSSNAVADDKPKKQKKRKHLGSLTLHTFKGQDSNQKTNGKKLKGKDAPLVNAAGEEVELSTLLGKPLVLVFMRGFNGDICPYCTSYTAQMAVRYKEFKEAGAELIVVYPTRDKDAEQVELFKELVEEIIAEEGETAIPFPVYLDLGTRVVQKYKLTGDLSKPTTFILDRDGSIRYLYVGRDTDDRPAIDRVIAEVKKIGQE